MIGYQTHQRNQLISFFEAHPNETFTIDEITEKLRDQLGQDAPSRSTVYRTVADLEKEKLLQRMYLADRRRSAYQYRDQHACASHLHIRCEKCHALVHLDADVSMRSKSASPKCERIAGRRQHDSGGALRKMQPTGLKREATSMKKNRSVYAGILCGVLVARADSVGAFCDHAP